MRDCTGKHSTGHDRIQLHHSHVSAKLVSSVSPANIAQLALEWLTSHTGRTHGVRNDSDADEGESTLQANEPAGRRRFWEQLADGAPATKSAVVRAVKHDWPAGLSYHQVAQLDVQHFLEKGTGKSWTAYRADLPADAPVPSPSQLFERFQTAFGAYHAHYLHLATLTAPHPLTLLRIQLLPSVASTSTSTSTPHPPAITLLHLPATPLLLLPTSLPAALRPLVKHALAAAFDPEAPAPLEGLELEGRDWAGLHAVLLGRMSAGEAGCLEGKAEARGAASGQTDPKDVPILLPTGVPPLPIPGAKTERARKRRRLEEVQQVVGAANNGGVAGGSGLPKLERVDYSISLPFPSASPSTTAPTGTDENTAAATPPPFLLRLEGTHVLAGLTALSVDRPLPDWLGARAVVEEGRNRIRVGVRGDGSVGRV